MISAGQLGPDYSHLFPFTHTEFLSASVEGKYPIIWGCKKHCSNLPVLRQQTVMETHRLCTVCWSNTADLPWYRMTLVFCHIPHQFAPWKQQCCPIHAGPKLYARQVLGPRPCGIGNLVHVTSPLNPCDSAMNVLFLLPDLVFSRCLYATPS